MLENITQTEMVVYLAIVTGFLAGAFVVSYRMGGVTRRLDRQLDVLHTSFQRQQKALQFIAEQNETLQKDVSHMKRERDEHGRFKKKGQQA